MTPTAITPAARRRANGASASGPRPGTSALPKRSAPAAPGQRRTVRPNPVPRRVSGPLRSRAATAPKRAPRLGRGRVRTRNEAPLAHRAVAFVRALPDHQFLDRVVRGRAWIAILGVMLAGIVAMQVEVLKLGATMGRAIEQGTALQSRNELLRESVASLADEQRIERLAGGLGMVMPQPGVVGFLAARQSNASKAAAGVKAPDAAAFLSLLSSNGAVATPPTAASLTSTTPSVQTTPSIQTPASATSSPTVSTPAAPITPATGPTASGTSSITPATGPTTPATPATSPSSTGGTGQTPQGAGTGAATAVATGGGASVTGG